MEDAELLARRADHLVRLTKKGTANLSDVARHPATATGPIQKPRPGPSERSSASLGLHPYRPLVP